MRSMRTSTPIWVSSPVGFFQVSNVLTKTGPSPNSLWITTAISLTQSVALPLYGRLSDIFGRRWFFIGGNILVLAAMLIGSQAKSVNMAIAAVSVMEILAIQVLS
jgi:MFS family permease